MAVIGYMVHIMLEEVSDGKGSAGGLLNKYCGPFEFGLEAYDAYEEAVAACGGNGIRDEHFEPGALRDPTVASEPRQGAS